MIYIIKHVFKALIPIWTADDTSYTSLVSCPGECPGVAAAQT